MEKSSFTTTVVVDKSPKEAFDVINNVRGWWNREAKGSSKALHDEFEVRFGDVHYSRQKLTEFEVGKKVTWLVTESRLNFLKDKAEWTGTTISFDISQQGGNTQIRFTHQGLVPEIECFDACSNAWTEYMQDSLKELITEGKGKPYVK